MYSPTQKVKDQVNKTFTYQPPKGDQPTRYQQIRDKGKELAELIISLTPESREQSLALTKLQEVIMFANASIAINEVV